MSRLLCRVIASAALLACSVTAIAQSSNVNEGSTPLALAPGAPAGSYPLSGFENINPYSGSLSFRFPLMTVGGRGQAQYTIAQNIQRKWSIDRYFEQFEQQWYYEPKGGSWNGITPGFTPGVMQGRYGGSINTTNCLRNGVTLKIYTQSLTRLTFTAPDGTEFELRDKLTDGTPANVPACATSGFSRGKVFVTADGSSATFISDNVITDQYIQNSYGPFTVSGYLMLADGTRYRFQNGYVQWIRDRNGNKVSFTYTCPTCGTLTQITDPLNRQITPGTGITFKGTDGASRSIQIVTGSALRSDYTAQTYAALFPELNGSSQTLFTGGGITSITLPNSKQYKFFYNPYGELARVELPTGGAIEYDWAAGLTNSNASGAVDLGPTFGGVDNWQIYRRLVERRVYPNGGTGSSYESKMTISRPETIDASLNIQSVGYVIVDRTNPAGTLLSREKHYYFGNAGTSLKTHSGVSYESWKDGREYKTEFFDADGATILRRIENTWQQPIAGSSWPLTQAETTGAKPNNPQITETITTIEPSGANLVSKQTFSYDKYLNRTDVYEYGFGTGAAGALIRRTNTTYVTTNTVGGVTYDYACDPATNCNASATIANVIHIRNLPKQVSVYDAAGVERTRSSNEFDNYTADTTHATLTNRSSISGFDSSFTTSYVTRGNATASSQYLLNTSGQVTGSTTLSSQYDIAGNVVKAIDARGCATNIDFTDRFGSPDADARLNSAPLELSSVGQASYAFPTQITNCLNHTRYTQFDYYVNRPVDFEDANGVVSSSYSVNEPLDRPTKVIVAANKDASVKSQTAFTYNDDTRTVTTASDKVTFADGLLVNATVYDGLGRTKESRHYEGGTNYIAIQTEYDNLGRAYKTSNPFRPWQSESPVFSTTVFDSLNRVRSVTTSDSAAVSTSYSGNTVTVTDQAGKVRKSVTDALGRLTDVYEDPSGLNYQTTYLYDTLDDLVKVTQGTQQRFFMYDSLKRLIRADNPEQENLSSLDLLDPITNHSNWSVKYDYDANSNLTSKTDARGTVTQNSYDSLNRLTTVLYRINGQPDPNTGDIEYLYDNATNGKGRLWLTYRWGAKPSQTSIGQYDALGRVKQVFNMFGDGLGGWSAGYEVDRSYNLAGQPTSQTYPSGRTVSYGYDSAGRTSSLTGNLGDGVTRTYASTFVYNSRSQITQELFGTATPLYHKLQYNVRGQLWDVRVSTNPDVNGSMNRGGLQYFYDGSLGYGTSGPDNNGNVRFANTYTPEDDQDLHWAIHRQSYAYDSLNRLKSVTEYFINYSHPESQQSVQTYDYDRWGNRTINAAQTSGTGINNKAFEVETARNRLYSPGDLALADAQRRINYDKAGNQVKDTYTGYGTATYDGDNHIVAIQDKFAGSSTYTYNSNAQRVRRKISNVETWQIYGIDGELVAEYAANAAVSTPQKEYGYRDGQLLITAEPGAAQNVSWTNAAGVSVNGNSLTKTAATGWGNAGASSTQSIAAGDGYVEATATETTTARLFGFSHTDADQNWPSINFGIDLDLSGLVYVFESGTNRGSFGPYAPGDKFQVAIVGGVVKYKKNGTVFYTSSVSPTYPLVVDTALHANGCTLSNVVLNAARLQWLVPDHLGTPRIILDQTGSIANLKRHDYLPFGEELTAGTGGRIAAMGYVSGDGIRQQFTSKERDVEIGLDYFLARYYSSTQGRFTSPDEFTSGTREIFVMGSGDEEKQALPYAEIATPQSLNKYQYAYNNPLRYFDPDGHDVLGYELVTSGPNQVPNTPHPEVPGLKTLGPVDTATGGYFPLNLKVNFDKGDNIQDYKHLRTAIILNNSDVRSGSQENPNKSQMAISGQTRIVFDEPGIGISGAPKATLAGQTIVMALTAGEYNTKTKQLSTNLAYYAVKLVFDKNGRLDQTKSIAIALTRQEFIDLTKKDLPIDKATKQPCPECTLKK